MSGLTTSVYAEWRARHGAGAVLRETPRPFPSERLLQHVWQHQRLLRDQLISFDGVPVTVLHPGFWNHEAGPDFRGAVIQFGADTPRSGDVEIDLQPSAWRSHGHDRNPAYRGVVLHVVWDGDATQRYPLVTVALKSRLDAPLAELVQWLGGDPAPPGLLAGQCSAPLRELSEPAARELLRQAAFVRLQRKAAELAARARQAGWGQALVEGLCAALGYKHNVWPMRRLAELAPRLLAGDERLPVNSLQARLLGVSGLLPADLKPSSGGMDLYVRRAWDHWWRERDALEAVTLPRTLWRFSGLRPANHPQRRLALAAHWMASGDLTNRLDRWFTTKITDSRLAGSLLKILQVEKDDFWSWHWTLTSERFARPQPLLGLPRATDLAVNVILPWLWARADTGNNAALREAAEHRYFAWPAAEDNAVLRLARQRLLGGRRAPFLRAAAMQQGLLQIVRDFCEHSNALCQNCRFPELVRSLGSHDNV